MASFTLAGLATALLCFYPILAYYGMRQGLPTRWMAVGLLLLLGIRWGRTLVRKVPPYALIAVMAAALASAWIWGEASVWFYPVAVNLTFLIVFGLSLWMPPPLIERLARLRHPDLDGAGVRYTRKVTQIWCAFFALNGSAALWTALAGNPSLWAFYNGFLAYVLMGLLFAGEWLVRRRVMAGRPS